MADTASPVVHVSDLEMRERVHGASFASRSASISRPLGLTRLGARIYEVPPGKTVCPFHVHKAVDELFLILSGEGEYRFGEKTYPVRAGDALGAPMGDESRAHQLWNTGSETLRYFAISSTAEFDVCLYPDSSKFAVYNEIADLPEARMFDHIGRKENALDYWDGEETGGRGDDD